MIGKLLKQYEKSSLELKASLWFLIGTFFQKGISMISTPIFTRVMSAEDYGEFNVFTSWFLILSIIVTCQLSAGVFTQGIVKFDNEKKIFASSMQGLSTILVILWTIIYTVSRGFWNEVFRLNSFQVYSILLLSWLTSAYNFWAIEQRVDLKYKKMLVMTFFVTICQPLLGLILVLNLNDKASARILGMVIISLIAYSWCFGDQMRAGKKFYIKKYWIYALSLCIPLVPHYLSQIIMSTSDRIMIDRMVGTREAGIYSLAYSISQIMTLFNTGLMQTIEPWLYKKIKNNELEKISSIVYVSMGGIATVNIILIALAPEVVRVFAPIEYYEAIWIIPPVAMSVFVSFMYAFFAVFEFYYEKTKYITAATLVGAIVNIVLNFLLIPVFGYYAAGYTTLLGYIIYIVLHYCFMDRICRINRVKTKPYNIKILLLISLIFFAVSFLLLLTYKYSILRYGILFLVIIIMFIIREKIIRSVKSIINIRKH